MPADKTRGAKTQTLSLRLDPKTRFMLEFMARIKGQTITMVVERAIKETAERTGVGPEWDEQGKRIEQETWSVFWDPNEGRRALSLLANPYYPTTYDEDELRTFTKVHQPFFYADRSCEHPRRAYLEVLWPNIGRYLIIWREKKSEDYWAAGEAMAEDLSTARVVPPDWPPKAEPKEQPAPKAQQAGDLEDEIPF